MNLPNRTSLFVEPPFYAKVYIRTLQKVDAILAKHSKAFHEICKVCGFGVSKVSEMCASCLYAQHYAVCCVFTENRFQSTGIRHHTVSYIESGFSSKLPYSGTRYRVPVS